MTIEREPHWVRSRVDHATATYFAESRRIVIVADHADAHAAALALAELYGALPNVFECVGSDVFPRTPGGLSCSQDEPPGYRVSEEVLGSTYAGDWCAPSKDLYAFCPIDRPVEPYHGRATHPGQSIP